MGKTLLVWRLVVKDVRHHAAEALLLLLAIGGLRLRPCRLDCPCMGRRMIPMRRPERQRMAPTWLRTCFPRDQLATSRRTQPS